MKIAASDDFLVQFCRMASGVLRMVGDLETRIVSARLDPIRVERPIFVTGLARAGSTMLLELLASINGVATHRYRDFPFVATPCLWNRFLDRFPAADRPSVERPHRDRIRITRESPEAMEEPLWMTAFPHLHSPTALHRLTAETSNPQFERFYLDHLRKILLIRDGTRYVAKNNYHVTRIEYLARLYPDAEFIIPIRNPVSHVHSLVRQHRLFCDYARDEPRVIRWLKAAGHFEFGPQRIPIRLNVAAGNRIVRLWEVGDEVRGYSIQWSEIYGFVRDLILADNALSRRMHVVRYEDFCAEPVREFTALLRLTGLDIIADDLPSLQHIAVSAAGGGASDQSEQQNEIREEVSRVAEYFGYEVGSGL